MKIGCQTIIFGNEMHKERIETVFKTVAEAGYAGVEIGFARLDAAKAQDYAALLNKYSLEMAAVHIGGNYHDEESVKMQLAAVPEIIKFTKTLKCGNIFLSGRKLKEEEGEDYRFFAESINKLGKIIRDEGLTLSYHNHAWEIENGLHGINTIEQYTEKENLSFVLDVGWVVRGGGDPIGLIDRLGSRVSNIHFKEFTAAGGFTELGKGVVDFKPIYDVIKDKGFGWLIIEQDKMSPELQEIVATVYKSAVSGNYAYLKNLGAV